MKILHITDIHSRKEVLENIKNYSFDVLCITGDLINNINDVEMIKNYLFQINKPICLSSGNHDFDFANGVWFNEFQKKNIFLDNSIVEVNGRTFGIVKYKNNNFDEYNNVDVLLYHEPPKNSNTAIHRDTKEDSGSIVLRSFLENYSDKLVLCGHQHYPIQGEDIINGNKIINSNINELNTTLIEI